MEAISIFGSIFRFVNFLGVGEARQMWNEDPGMLLGRFQERLVAKTG